MNIIPKAIKNLFSKSGNKGSIKRPVTMQDFEPIKDLYGINEDKALRLATVWACVKLRAQVISSAPLYLKNRDNEIAYNHPLYTLLHDQPNANMCASEFWEAMIACLDLWGNAYAQIRRNSRGDVISIDPLSPEAVTPYRDEVTGLMFYEVDTTNHTMPVLCKAEDILHLKGFSLDGLKGLSVLQYASDTINSGLNANKASDWQFRNGLKIGGVIESGERILQPEQRERLRDSLNEFSDFKNSGKYLILEAGQKLSTVKDLKINPVDAQLLESRGFNIEEICRIFGVPPQLIYHTDKASSWSSSLEQTNMGFLTYSLNPVMTKIEQTVARTLLSTTDKKKYHAKFSTNALMRADSQGRSMFYAHLLQNGVMTRNEARDLENLPPIEGADSLTVQLNMTDLATLNEIQMAKFGTRVENTTGGESGHTI